MSEFMTWRLWIAGVLVPAVGGMLIGSAAVELYRGDYHQAALRGGIGLALWLGLAAYFTYDWHWGCRRRARANAMKRRRGGSDA